MNRTAACRRTGFFPHYRFYRRFCFFSLTAILFSSSCAVTVKEQVAFTYAGFGEGTVLFGLSKASIAGELGLSGKTESLRFCFEPPVNIGADISLEAEYSFRPAGGGAGDPGMVRVVASFGGESGGSGDWEFPRGAAFLLENGAAASGTVLSYALPLGPGTVSEFSIAAIPGAAGDSPSPKSGAAGVWALRSLKLVPRWYGFDLSLAAGARPLLKFTPYLERDNNGSLVVSPRPEHGFQNTQEIRLGGVEGDALISAGGARFEYRPPRGSYPFPSRGRFSGSAELLIPSGALGGGIYPVTLSGANPDSVFSLSYFIIAPGPRRPFPREPIPADPGLILFYPEENWRSPAYEVFRWPDFPEILIIDTADYAVQERLFKRLAFFVEKRGYRGRLVPDRELEGLHGWNAHDYRAEDLARFFEAARLDGFPLLDEERGLCTLLLENGILMREPDGEILPGLGGVLSISRESSDSLRDRFMIHECFHGLFFIDEDFRNFSAGRWENFSPEAKRFFTSYLDFMSYDTAFGYLAVNEFMSYCLQQPASHAPYYFGEYIAGQIAASPLRRAALFGEEQTTASGIRYWPALARVFSREAGAFSDYASGRWGFSAGAVYSVRAE
ncbi:MAG: hypothetical protein LBI91_00055 [Spirochaetaceae bacterium]|jgi:hypothetical protein|nr:hypothetical protein [Spirochaetaceae bacterium]